MPGREYPRRLVSAPAHCCVWRRSGCSASGSAARADWSSCVRQAADQKTGGNPWPPLDPSIVSATAQHGRLACHDRGMVQGEKGEHHGKELVGIRGLTIYPDNVASIVHREPLPAHRRDVRMCIQVIRLYRKARRLHCVIAIQYGDITRAREPQRLIGGAADTLVLLPMHDDAHVLFDVARDNAGGVIRAAVIHYDKFEVVYRLIEDAFDGLADVGRTVVGGHEDAYAGYMGLPVAGVMRCK